MIMSSIVLPFNEVESPAHSDVNVLEGVEKHHRKSNYFIATAFVSFFTFYNFMAENMDHYYRSAF